VIDLQVEIGAPPPEVVVNVNGGYALATGAGLEASDRFGHGQCRAQQPLSIGEIEVVDHVDQEQSDTRLLGNVGMKIGILGWRA
jgi:hypothetical protein